MGFFRSGNRASLLWQIEHNGPWHWEIADIARHLYLRLGGPNAAEHGWEKKLEPGESFESVAAAIAIVDGGFEDALAALTGYRRRIRRPNSDNLRLPVIFNDYMNCLNGDPTTDRLRPLIEAAAQAGCEYFCVDAGWYSDGDWWDGVGEWRPSSLRFPAGLGEVMGLIRSHGMIGGLWLELEVMGIKCPLASQVDDSWFFQKRGKRVIDHSRFQLDYRNPEVRAYADSVIDRLVSDFGIGYIKMDYNIDVAAGSDYRADSSGDGLMGHNRAYLAWLDSVFARLPDLVIENCGSGGMRMEYSLLSRHSIQSVSDQTDYIKMAAIAAGAPAAVTPEQSAIWCYPMRDADREAVAFNMVNALLQRIHQSGHLAELSAEGRALVAEGIAWYKGIRCLLPETQAFWPLGLPSFQQEAHCLGLRHDASRRAWIAVWNRALPGGATILVPTSMLGGQILDARIVYPGFAKAEGNPVLDSRGNLCLQTAGPGRARLLEVRW
jgi:alpha-galactosidase